jgi:hypothetical protein
MHLVKCSELSYDNRSVDRYLNNTLAYVMLP